MCDEQTTYIGDVVSDETVVYRGCSRRNFLNVDKTEVKANAFWKDGKNHTDGLSLALNPLASVKHLKKNHGIIRMRVGDIRALGRKLEVRFDTSDQEHVILRNLPCMDREAAERADAEAIALELASIAEIESGEPVKVPIEKPSQIP